MFSKKKMRITIWVYQEENKIIYSPSLYERSSNSCFSEVRERDMWKCQANNQGNVDSVRKKKMYDHW